MQLKYNSSKWQEVPVKPVNTLQVFITDRCNLRCRGCFYSNGLANSEMSIDNYIDYLQTYSNKVEKVILLGGEPLLYSNLKRIIEINNNCSLKTTIYTNGRKLDKLKDIPKDNIELRIGVYGVDNSEKPLCKVEDTDWPVKIVYMLRRDNIGELYKAAEQAEKRFNCKSFYISSIRDTVATGDYWAETEDTIPLDEFADIVQEFVNNYNGNIPRLDIATRGVITTEKQDFMQQKTCRFGNIFSNGDKIICPFDISSRKTSLELFTDRNCNKHNRCILQKIVLKRI